MDNSKTHKNDTFLRVFFCWLHEILAFINCIFIKEMHICGLKYRQVHGNKTFKKASTSLPFPEKAVVNILM